MFSRSRSRVVVVAALVSLVITLTPARAAVLDLATGDGAVTAQSGTEVRIVRDQFGVPHVYGPAAGDVAYGAGYALAQDRLWQMHVFRLIGKGRLSDLLGPLVVDIDKEVRFFTYTEAERQARFESVPQDLQDLLRAFVDGINARIAEVRTNPGLLPFEFVEFGVGPPEDWTITDSIGLQDVLILSFGSGGGNELRHAELLVELQDRFGDEEGQTMFDDLVLTVDDDGPISIPADFDYTTAPTFAREADAEPRRGLTDDARISLDAAAATATAAAAAPTARGTEAQRALIPDITAAVSGLEPLERGRRMLERVFRFGSNAQIVGSEHTEAGNAAQTAGPQVGYLLPQWLADIGLHTTDPNAQPRLDATGMTFAGAGPAVLIGRGPGYAWTTTTGAGDLTDTYVERLDPEDPRRYLFDPDGPDGPEPVRSEPMECRTETYALRGIPFEEQEICRTRHGPVVSFDEANGVAYALRYAWFNREQQTIEGFFRYNEVTSLEDFATFANFLSSNHNMFYVDDQGGYGFWHAGNFPIRTEGIDLRLPQDGSGGSEWQGLRPITDVPHAVNFDQGWLVNWNNQPAVGWERERAWPAIDNADDLERTLDPALPAVPDPHGGLVNPDRAVDFEDLSANLRYGAFRHHRLTWFDPYLPADADLASDRAREAAAVVRSWDGFNTDRDGNGLDDSAGRTIVDRWVSLMRSAAFADDLGDLAGWAREDLLWHLLNQEDTVTQGFDWLNGEEPAAFAVRVFEQAVDALAEERGGPPESWRGEVDLQHYQRLNADLFADTIAGSLGLDSSEDTGLPGDVRDHIAMDRGTYNHVVVFQQPPAGEGPLGLAAARAGSVIPPGQSGHIDPLGQEAPHYEDQLELYEQWRYKPMPLTLEEARALAESEVVIIRR